MYYEFTILLQGRKQYQFTPHDRACEGPFQWRYWAAGRDAKRATGDALDTEPGHRDHLVRPLTGRLRFWHSHGSPSQTDRDTDYWVDVGSAQTTIDYGHLTCPGVDPR